MKVVVTGGSGFIDRSVIQNFANHSILQYSRALRPLRGLLVLIYNKLEGLIL